MTILVTATKGGAGATVVAASIALSADRPAVLIDLAGDLSAALGVAERRDVGMAAWLSSDAPPHRLDELLEPVDDSRAVLLPWAREPEDAATTPERWRAFAGWCAARTRGGDAVVVDAGRHAHHLASSRPATAAPTSSPSPAESSTYVLTVTRACYLALRTHAASVTHRPPADGVVLVAEPGRALAARDVERALGAPVLATVPWDVQIARSVDSGLMAATLPRTLRRAGRAIHAVLARSVHPAAA